MFYAAQLLMILFAFFSGRKEGIYLEAVRKLPYGNHFEKPYHLWGWLAAATVGVFATLLQTEPKAQILAPFGCAVLYWIVYEIAYNKPVFGKWNYVGKTARLDKWLWKTFGEHTERWVVILKGAGVVILNLIYIL